MFSHVFSRIVSTSLFFSFSCSFKVDSEIYVLLIAISVSHAEQLFLCLWIQNLESQHFHSSLKKVCSVFSVGYNSSSEFWMRLSKRNSECLISHVGFLNRQENSTRELSLKHSDCFMPRIFLDHSLSFVKRLTIPTLPLYLKFLSNQMLWSLCLKVRGFGFLGGNLLQVFNTNLSSQSRAEVTDCKNK